MTLTVYDYGEEYQHDHYDLLLSGWGYIQVELEGFLEDLPWSHADRVDAEVIREGVRYRFSGSVTVPSTKTDYEGRTEVTVRLFGTEYVPEMATA